MIEGLAPNIMDRGEINTIMKGYNQDFQMSSPLQKYNNDISELVGGNGDHLDANSPTRNDYRT